MAPLIFFVFPSIFHLYFFALRFEIIFSVVSFMCALKNFAILIFSFSLNCSNLSFNECSIFCYFSENIKCNYVEEVFLCSFCMVSITFELCLLFCSLTFMLGDFLK